MTAALYRHRHSSSNRLLELIQESERKEQKGGPPQMKNLLSVIAVLVAVKYLILDSRLTTGQEGSIITFCVTMVAAVVICAYIVTSNK